MQKLIFVYSAHSGNLNAYLDSLHKIVSPSTYACKLCDLTYGVFREREVWKKFREENHIEMKFYHIDEFRKAYAEDSKNFNEFPFILKEENKKLEMFLSVDALDTLKTDQELIGIIRTRIPVL
ncbi:GTPase [Leeuwenhoekiella polynyae]|uniref:GTPase n=1 Tax=Leeuwenhoekiella polynyae TaxID=1550906 RepID=A0A4Q0PEP9_9FLAO|nr:GTPase [Leeuwenhoekiella polynyae]RXG25345.1 hypothetical protein DSM02_1316 [Leeuwenhoekiella polynyae]|tara:strand:+ start:256 stop:624 length:369 start_codon:yes stop_codon:yes gene_type:complete